MSHLDAIVALVSANNLSFAFDQAHAVWEAEVIDAVASRAAANRAQEFARADVDHLNSVVVCVGDIRDVVFRDGDAAGTTELIFRVTLAVADGLDESSGFDIHDLQPVIAVIGDDRQP